MGKQEEKLKMEIEHIARHQEIDKLNYNDGRFIFIGGLATIFAFVAILQNISSIDKYLTLKFIFYDILFLTGLALFIFLSAGWRKSNKHFMIREKMIEKRLLHFGISKDDIDEEFTKKQTFKSQHYLFSLETLMVAKDFLLGMGVAVFSAGLISLLDKNNSWVLLSIGLIVLIIWAAIKK